MKDYSQDREQIAIMQALGGEDQARSNPQQFLEIGAWNPKIFSNTRALFDLGWRGICIEPSPGPMCTLLDEYGNEDRIVLVQAAVGITPGLEKMHITDDAVSSSDDATFQKWKETAKFRGSIYVPVITVDQLMNQFGGADVWSIDAEGVSVDLFHRMVAREIHPKVVVVEYDDRLPELMSAASNASYCCTFTNATNAVLVAQ